MPTPHQEVLVLNTLKYYQAEYKEGVPLSILKLDLDLSDDQLHEIIHSMKSKGTATLAGGNVKLVESESSDQESIEEIEVVDESALEVPEEVESPETLPTQDETHESFPTEQIPGELTERERESLKIIRSIVDESGLVSRHILEGNLLYGDLMLSDLQVYNLLNSLQNKGLLTLAQMTDGAYYRLLNL